MKVDVVMWVRDAPSPEVLRRIVEVIPAEFVNHRFLIVDRESIDGFPVPEGWRAVLNNGRGISDGANTALSLVETEFFVSVEADLILHKDWWSVIQKLIDTADVISGVRVASNPKSLGKLQRYVQKKYFNMPSWMRSRSEEASTLGMTFDNTIYRASALQKVNGFPKSKASAVDTLLANNLRDAGFKWLVIWNLVSLHIRRDWRGEYQHQQMYGCSNRVLGLHSFKRVLLKTAMSVGVGLLLVLKLKEPGLFFRYPLMKIAYLKGWLTKREN